MWETLSPLFEGDLVAWPGPLFLLGQVNHRGHIWSSAQCHPDYAIQRKINVCVTKRVSKRVGYR